METKQHQGKTLKYLSIEPDGYNPNGRYPLVVLLHGFGASMLDLAALAPAIDAEGYVYVCPNAPIPVQIGPGATGFAWTPPREIAVLEDVERAEEMLAVFLKEVRERYGVGAGQTVLGGFSQGGMMTYRWGLAAPDLFRGLVVLSSAIPFPESIHPRLPADRSQPIFIAHGVDDALISIEDARESRLFIESAGYAPDYREYSMGHEISQEVLNDLAPWIHGVLPPRRSP